MPNSDILPFASESPGLTLSRALWQQMAQHVQSCLPEEACGLVAGLTSAQIVYPITNQLHSPVRFRMDAQEQVAAMLALEQQGLELLAIYHSHPAGPPHPSPTDVAEYAYPGVAYLIWSKPPDQVGWVCRAFRLDERIKSREIMEIGINIMEET